VGIKILQGKTFRIPYPKRVMPCKKVVSLLIIKSLRIKGKTQSNSFYSLSNLVIEFNFGLFA